MNRLTGFKRMLTMAMAISVIAGMLSGCAGFGGSKKDDSGKSSSQTQTSSQESNLNKTGFPIVKEKITLKAVAKTYPIQSDFNDMVVLQNFEKKSNIDIEWTCIPNEFAQERRNIIMSSKELPDFFYKMSFPVTDISKYATQGLFVSTSDYIDYAPNIKASWDKHPDIKAGLTMPDGKIYSSCYVLEANPIISGAKYFFNSEALKQVNKEVPKTLDEFTEVLKLFKKLDYNKNGKPDEVPFTSSTFANTADGLKGAFGLGNVGSRHAYVDMKPGTNEIRFIQTAPEYKEYLQYLNMLYKEGLLDKEIFTMDLPKLIAKGEEGRALCYSFVNHSIIGTKYADKSVGITEPFKGPHGDQLWNNQGSALSTQGAFVITNANKFVPETMRWLDYWYSEDGVREFFMGIEGETYKVNEKGEYEYTDFVMKNPDGIMFEQVLGKYVPWGGGGNPSIANEKYFKGGEMHPISKASADGLSAFAPKKVWPSFMWADKDVDNMANISTDLQTYVKENEALFVTGQKSFNEWDSYVKGFKGLRIDDYMKIYDETRKRYGY